MSHFAQLLTTTNLPKHDGRTLWRYRLDVTLFLSLQKHLKTTKRLIAIDPRDCALYYAAWWKCCYNGGTPSKREVFRSIAAGHAFDEETFYEYAKRGATLLGIRWIRNQKTLYFRTLLLQGGLPVEHIANNQGAYTRFLVRILELNPISIDDFAFDPTITSLLPSSSRNDEVYACCLDIVKAIIAEDEDYLNILEQDNTLNQISTALKIKKQTLRLQRKKARFRTVWVLEPNQGQIRLYLSIPDMEAAEFSRNFLLAESEEALQYEYKLFFENKVLCKFIRNTNGHYKTLWAGQNDLTWDGNEQFAELYLMDQEGHRHDCGHLVGYVPRLNKPTLWSKYSDKEWILEKGTHTSQEDGLILFPETYHPDSPVNTQDLLIGNQTMKVVKFDGKIALSDLSQTFWFQTRSKKFEWQISDDRPIWMQKANFHVVSRKPDIHVFNEQGELINKFTKRWRQKGEHQWHSWNDPMLKGLIEMCIETDNVVETDEFFNIGSLQLDTVFGNLHQAEIGITGNDFIFRINESELISIEPAQYSRLRLLRKDTTRLPGAIVASLALRNQGRSLRFEIAPPFEGFELIDKDQCIVASGNTFMLDKLHGYRLISNQQNLVVNLYNSKRAEIILSERITEQAIPLMHFEDKIVQLFSLSDPLDGHAEVVLEICQEQNYYQRKVREYKICRYTQKVDCRWDENNNLIIQTTPYSIDLYAVPIDCSSEAILLYDLEQTDGGYVFRKQPEWEKCIVFGNSESGVKIKPAFVSIIKVDEQTSPADRLRRITGYRDRLLKSNPPDEPWQQLLGYYRICLNNNLPFATFDVLRASSFSSELVAKLFLFLLCYDESENFLEQAYKRLEDDLGFSFHWAAATHWNIAIDWVGCTQYPALFNITCEGITRLFANQHPANQFAHLRNYLLQGVRPSSAKDISLNQRINELRATLGSKVLSGIPQDCPKIPDEYKDILPVTADNGKVKLLLKSPVSVALSIAGKDDNLWCEDGEHIRRNVKYSYQLHPGWYAGALIYTLSKLKS